MVLTKRFMVPIAKLVKLSLPSPPADLNDQTSNITNAPANMSGITQIASKEDYNSLVVAATGKTVLAAFWPDDKSSSILLKHLDILLPESDRSTYGVVGVYAFDAYASPELVEEIGITSVPTLIWFNDGIRDGSEWHEGVRIEGEKIRDGVKRVVDRIKTAGKGLGGDEDDDCEDAWENC